MMFDTDFTSPLAIDGRIWLENALDDAALSPFDSAASLADQPGARMQAAAALAAALRWDGPLAALVGRALPGARPVRAAVFDAEREEARFLPWRQDREVALATREDAEGFGNWSSRAGIWHAEAPESVLQRMLVARVILSDAPPEGGALELALGSHRAGLSPSHDASEAAAGYPVERRAARRGDVLLTKMLLIHRTQDGDADRGRRWVRVDYAEGDPPAPLSWAM